MDTIRLTNVTERASMVLSGIKWREHLNSYLTDVSDIIKYFGIVFLFLLFLHLLRFKRWDRRENIFWVPVISYSIFLILLFGIVTDIRYLIPIVPFLIALAIPSLLSLGKKWKLIIVALCVIQFVSTSIYVHQQRQISPSVKGGFEYIKKNVPENALILYPEENLLIHGQRKMVWSAVKCGLDLIFWSTEDKQVDDLLKANQIDHILIKNSRIYDDSKDRHLGGYPKSFVEKLPRLEGWTKIFENQELTLWKRV
jgi:hypothetical protein